MLRMGVHTHLITCTEALPLMLRGEQPLVIEMTDGTHQYNQRFRQNVGFYYEPVKANVERIVIGLTAELADTDATAVAVTPGWLRSERMLENFGVTDTDGTQPDCWRYLDEIQDPGLTATELGYR